MLVLLALTLVAVPLGFYVSRHRPNLYDHTRTDLLEAKREFNIYHHDMEMLVQEKQLSTEALKASLKSLQEAASMDPEDAAEIKAIGTGLQSWEQLARTGTLSSEDLDDQYHSLAARVQRLVKKRTEASQTRESPGTP